MVELTYSRTESDTSSEFLNKIFQLVTGTSASAKAHTHLPLTRIVYSGCRLLLLRFSCRTSRSLPILNSPLTFNNETTVFKFGVHICTTERTRRIDRYQEIERNLSSLTTRIVQLISFVLVCDLFNYTPKYIVRITLLFRLRACSFVCFTKKKKSSIWQYGLHDTIMLIACTRENR